MLNYVNTCLWLAVSSSVVIQHSSNDYEHNPGDYVINIHNNS